jgi:ribonucleoside-diphosphate reductase alpha chain/ribonucleoside-triphosphate reductase
MKDMGFKWKPEVGQTKENAKTIVFEFPMKSPKGKTKFDVPAVEQLETYKMFMENYTDHNVSITVTVKDDEWDSVEEWMWNNWDSVVAVSFLPLSDSMYELLPYESIEKEVYEEMLANLPKFQANILQKYEKGEEFEIIESECAGGSCPVK